MSSDDTNTFEYDVALSFAGEDRQHADALAALLRSRGIRVFYDIYEQVNLWGKDLYEHLADIYPNKARYCVMFLSAHYARKTWTNHECQNAQARAFREHKEYILPVKLDDTIIPGNCPTQGYIDLRQHTIEREDARKLMNEEQALMLQTFVDWLRVALEMQRQEEEAATTLEISTLPQAIRLMTIHHAKGLEFPIVIIPEVQKKLRRDETPPDFMLTDNQGLDVYLVLDNRDTRSTSLAQARVAQQEELLREEMRIFYVAVTRAQHSVITIGSRRTTQINSSIAPYYSWHDEILKARSALTAPDVGRIYQF